MHTTARQIRQHERQRAWCEWDDFDAGRTRILAALRDPHGPAWPPFHLLAVPGITPAQLRQCAQRWVAQRLADSADARATAAPGFARRRPRAPDEPLRVGYLSSDFHDHATAHLLVEVIEAHDRARVSPRAYSHGRADHGPMRQRLTRAFDGFCDIAALDDASAARQIHADGIDILVDLKGYTAGSRSLLLAWRAAPLAVSFLGYPGTLGALADYLVTDRFVTPADQADGYSEALAFLPDSYQPHARLRPAGPGPDPTGDRAAARPRARAAHGLPDEAPVFCNFNQAWKFTPEVLDSWCRVLARVPHSVLWLLHSAEAEGNLRQQALARGIGPHRLVFAPPQGQAQHLARLPLADLVLDTWPYNAHTTASDALAAGVPVLTHAGDRFAGRVAGSLLHAVGLPELVTDSAAALEDLACALALDRPRLAALRQRLAEASAMAPLFDVPRYTGHLESLYQAMWARHALGLAPRTVSAVAGTGG